MVFENKKEGRKQYKLLFEISSKKKKMLVLENYITQKKNVFKDLVVRKLKTRFNAQAFLSSSTLVPESIKPICFLYAARMANSSTPSAAL